MENSWIRFDRDFDPDLDMAPFEAIAKKLGCEVDDLEMVSDCGDASDRFWEDLDSITVSGERFMEVGDSILSLLTLEGGILYVEQKLSSYPGGTVFNTWRKAV